ncbi:MAG: TGS domain-containing protein [Nanoarchaeota archaeon]|nr:TGS domain-containing protein [Nanoarchaeota archaeon]
MPVNATADFYKAESHFLAAKTREEKIAALEEMIRAAPKHKGAEAMLSQLKQRLAKLKSQSESKSARKSVNIPKEADAQICILGLTQSGKSALLRKLTNAKPKISELPYTTTKPEIGVADYCGVKLQMIEIPSSFRREFMSIAQNCDAIVLLARSESDKKEMEKIMERFRIRKPSCFVSFADNAEETKKKIWGILGLIKVYTKEPGKKPETKPMVLKAGASVGGAVADIHKDFLKFFRFARIWGSTKFPGEKVGLEHRLKDDDVMEVHAG